MEPLIEGEKFARKCDITGEGMNEGYVVDEFTGTTYIKHKSDLLNHLRLLNWEGADGVKSQDIESDEALMEFFYDEEYYYWTEWFEDEFLEYVVKNGVLVEIEN
jgi:hypothetical protein